MRWLIRELKRALFVVASIVSSVAFAQQAAAQAYLETGQTGAQTQIDLNHTTTIYIGAPASFNFGGANYVMKRGSNSTADVNFTVYPNAACTGTPLTTVTNTSTAFDSSYAPVLFQVPGNITLAPGVYCTKLTSNAVDQQNEAFFIVSASRTSGASGVRFGLTGVGSEGDANASLLRRSRAAAPRCRQA